MSKTLELAGYTSPLYPAPNTYNLPIQRCVEGFRRDNPPAVPQLALLIAVPRQMAEEAYYAHAIPYTLLQAIADLALIAFYYLLCVIEYTKPRMARCDGRQIQAARTVQFTVGSIGFFKNGQILVQQSPLDLLLTVDITNRKMELWVKQSCMKHQKTNLTDRFKQ